MRNVGDGEAESRDGGGVKTRRDGDDRDDKDTLTDAEQDEIRSRGRWRASCGANCPTPVARGLSGAEEDIVRRGLDSWAWERIRAHFLFH
ncbi:hypothetical protein BRARA_A03220 [Brassica rapa]|uniref:Uncharacterized protein n=1 Tax=Brassica campestris TaxID=3711 RepID=A0A398AS60_BRACM|nr:hypothetical protein BRARA_A03220 [Brassica rapa]